MRHSHTHQHTSSCSVRPRFVRAIRASFMWNKYTISLVHRRHRQHQQSSSPHLPTTTLRRKRDTSAACVCVCVRSNRAKLEPKRSQHKTYSIHSSTVYNSNSRLFGHVTHTQTCAHTHTRARTRARNERHASAEKRMDGK